MLQYQFREAPDGEPLGPGPPQERDPEVQGVGIEETGRVVHPQNRQKREQQPVRLNILAPARGQNFRLLGPRPILQKFKFWNCTGIS